MNIRETAKLIPGYDPFANAGECWFDEKAARKACDFFPLFIVHIEGEAAGMPFELEPWQKAIIANLFGWFRKDSDGRTVRRYRETLIYVPRKNGKTPMVAAIALYVLFVDKEAGQQNYIAASEREQAGMLFRHAQGMVEHEPLMASRSRVYGGNASAGQSRSIVKRSDNSFLRIISADAKGKHGGNPHLTIIDELHEQPDSALHDVLHTGMASKNRAQPLFISLTTADYDRDSICNEKYEYACKVRDGQINDVTFLPVIYEALDTDDWTDEKTWAKANPNLGVSVSIDYLRQECAKAQEVPRLQNEFKRLHLDIRTKQDVLWLPIIDWMECGRERFELPSDAALYGGIDLASKIDVAALVWVWKKDGIFYAKTRFWVPEKRIHRLEIEEHDPRYRLWRDECWLESTPGETIDYDFIRKTVLDDSRDRGVRFIGYDPWNATQFASVLKNNDGFEMVEFRQGYLSMNEPSKELERLITARKIVHENNPMMNWMIENAKARPDPAGNIKPVKPDPSGKQKIDGVVAMVMALGMSMRDPEDYSESCGVWYPDDFEEVFNEQDEPEEKESYFAKEFDEIP